MGDADQGDAMNCSSESTDDITNHKTIPGGDKKTPPAEPTEESIESPMGCAPVKRSASESNDQEPKGSQKQTRVDDYFPSASGHGNTQRNNNEQQKTKKSGDVTSKSKNSAQSAAEDVENDNGNNSKQRPGSVTRSLASLPKLRIEFDDTDDEGSKHSSWSRRDIAEYRSNYPNVRNDRNIKDNYNFYMNKMRSHPDGDLIDNIHEHWLGNYDKLEYHHGYIQWLFPLQEKGLNWSAEPLQKHEIELLKNEKKAMKRILLSYKLMLDFYGFELINEQTGEIRRLSGNSYKDRFRNLNTSSHNYLRITRILKCLGEFGYEYLKFPFLEQILRESIIENTLSNCLRSCKDYWIETLRDQDERRAIRKYARELIEYRNKGLTPPRSVCAQRPSSTAKQIKNLSLTAESDDIEDSI